MHEVHLVRAILETVEKQAAAQKAKRVKSVKIRFNPLTSHSGDHVQFSFDIVKKEIPLVQDATLELTEVEPTLVCAINAATNSTAITCRMSAPNALRWTSRPSIPRTWCSKASRSSAERIVCECAAGNAIEDRRSRRGAGRRFPPLRFPARDRT